MLKMHNNSDLNFQTQVALKCMSVKYVPTVFSILLLGLRLLGDSAYPNLMQLLTPYKDNGHLTAAQRNFNKTLSSERIDIEHTFGLLKQRFRQLYYTKLKGVKLISHFVRACVVLHNLADEYDLPFEYADPDDPNSLDVHNALVAIPPVYDNLRNGDILRTTISQHSYANHH